MFREDPRREAGVFAVLIEPRRPRRPVPEPLTAAEHLQRAEQRRAAAEARKTTATFVGQCERITKAGRRCRLPAVEETRHCAFHLLG